MEILRGTTSLIVPIRVTDANGIPKTGLVYNTTGLSAVFIRELDAAPTPIALATMTNGTWATGGFVEQNSTSLPGSYAVGLPNTAVSAADNSRWVEVYFIGTNAYAQPLRIDLVAVNMQDAVRAGLTALPNAAAEAAGGLYTRGSGAGQINQQANGQVDTNVARILNTASQGAAGYVGTDQSKITNPTATVDLSGTTIKNVDNAIANVTLVATTTTLANAPSDSAGVTTLLSRLSALRAGYLDNLSAGAVATAAALTSLQTDVTSLLARLGAFAGTGVNTVLGFLRAMSRSDLTAPSDMGGTYNPATDSLQAIEDSIGSIPVSDPLATVVPGSYAVGTAGYDIGQIPAIKAKTDTIGSTSVLVNSPLTTNATLAITQGDSYEAADGRSFDFTFTGLPSLIGSTGRLRFAPLGGTTSINLGASDTPAYYLTAEILSATQARFEMTSVQSPCLAAGKLRFETSFTLSNGDVITPVTLDTGKVTVSPQASP